MVGVQCERLHITGLLFCRAGNILWEARTQTRDAYLSMCSTKVRDSLVPSAWANSQADQPGTCFQKETQVITGRQSPPQLPGVV